MSAAKVICTVGTTKTKNQQERMQIPWDLSNLLVAQQTRQEQDCENLHRKMEEFAEATQKSIENERIFGILLTQKHQHPSTTKGLYIS